MKKLNYQLGISMVEILVALVISLFLLGGIVQVYSANKASYIFTDSISRIQENGRFALETMTQDLRMAGFFGCASFDPEDPDNITDNLDPDGTGYSDDYDFIGEGPIDGTDNDGLNGSDSVTIRGVKPGQVNVHPPFNVSTSATIFVNMNNSLQPGDISMLCNCRGCDIFQITNTTQGATANKMAVVHNTGTGDPGNYNPDNCKGGNAHCFSQSYGADASMMEMQKVTYSIAPGASGEPALWRSEFGTINDELVEGVEEMQVLYGLDTDDDGFPNRYVTRNDVPDLWDVISVRLMLLIRSENQFYAEGNQTYTFNGNTVTAADRRLRQVFTTTIALRNRIGS